MVDAAIQSESSSAFALLAHGVQRQLYRMDWTVLRPIQAKAIRTYLQTDSHILISAETAGGKTEAAFLPILSAISVEPTGSVRALYVGPLKALINDQFGRLEDLCTYLEMPVYRWHGDVAASRKEQLVRDPGGLLLITPESLESVLINRTSHLGRLFGGLRAIVIDEVHAFLDNERGLHLASLISRVRRYQAKTSRPFRVIGLSATVGDIAIAQHYLAPDQPDRVCVITDDGDSKEIQFRVHGYIKDSESENDSQAADSDDPDNDDGGKDDGQLKVMGLIAADLVEHCRMHGNLVFANAKGDIELYADMANEHCRNAGLPETFLVHHGSLAREVREDTEQTMKAGRAMTTICSSTLEMGIDIGSVRMVGQIGAPWSVASLKQRMGRSGRKDTEPRRLRLYVVCESSSDEKDPLAQIPIDMLQAIATCELMLKKWIEPPRPSSLDISTLTHQIISTIAETGAINTMELHERLCKAGPFRCVTPSLFARVLRQLGSHDVVEQGPDGKLILGLEGERIRSRQDFYAAFATRAEFTIVAGDRTLGTLPIDTVPKVGEHIVFAARRWQVVDIDAQRLVLHVQPARRRRRPRFTGGIGDVHWCIREEMRSLLTGDHVPIHLDKVSADALASARLVAHERRLARRQIVPLGDYHSLWLTWTGTACQRTLLALLESMGVAGRDREIAIECSVSAASLDDRLGTAVRRNMEPLGLANHVVPKQYRKYDHLFDESLLNEAISADRLDCPTAGAVIGESLNMPAGPPS
jgi:ATP-dependent Lhr-like helicase